MVESILLGIEVGGTKLQFGLGTGLDGRLVELVRADVNRQRGAAGIRQTIIEFGAPLVRKFGAERIGIGFGGPVDAKDGRIIHSFQIEGWDGFPIAAWCHTELGVPAVIENDSNLAGLAEARFGSGRDARVVFYSNVGSGIGGALVIDGELYRGGSGIAVAEIGHLRPGPDAMEAGETVESVASGWALAERTRQRIAAGANMDRQSVAQLLSLCDGNTDRLTGKIIADAVRQGNRIACDVFQDAIRTYGWALAQVVTLLSPDVLVIGGGVAQMDESLFLGPLRDLVQQYVIPPLRDSFVLCSAQLGEDVVVHGALALAANG